MTSFHWTKDANGTFENAASWSAHAVPGSSDDAILDAPGATPYTVTALANDTVGSTQTAAGATLAVSGGTFTVLNGTANGGDAGTVEAINGGSLVLDGGIFNGSSGGVILAGNGSQIDLRGVSIEGGLLETAGTGYFNAGNGVLNGTASMVTNQGSIFTDGGSLTLEGMIDNNGSINISDFYIFGIGGDGGILNIAVGTTALKGSGVVNLTTDNYSGLISGVGTGSILVNISNIIIGSGSIGDGSADLTFQNGSNGVIDCDVVGTISVNTGINIFTNYGLVEASGSGLIILYGNVVNTNMLRSINGGTLTIKSTVNDSDGGIIFAGDQSQVDLQGAIIIGGLLETSGTGYFNAGNGVLNGTASMVTNQGSIYTDGGSLTLEGMIDNNGSINLSGYITYITGYETVRGGNLIVAGGVTTLSGGGVINFTTDGDGDLISGVGGSTLDNVSNLITGTGSIGDGTSDLTFLNGPSGVINCASGNNMSVNTGANAVNNSGLIEASGGGSLIIYGSIRNSGTIEAISGSALRLQATIDDSVGGVIFAGDGPQVNLQSATSIGGVLDTSGTGYFQSSNGVLNGTSYMVTNQGIIYTDGGSLTLEGMIDNNGSIDLSGYITYITGYETVRGGNLIVAGGVTTLSGGGAINFTSDGDGDLISGVGGSTLDNVDNVIFGTGQIGIGDNNLTLINQTNGVIDGNITNGLTISTGANSISNAGMIESTNNGILLINSAVSNTGSIVANGGKLIVNATVTGSGFAAISAGTLDFSQANVAEAVDFLDASGTLELDQSQTYSGLIVGFSAAGGDALDLRDISFVSGQTTATYAGGAVGGVLTVTNGAAFAQIHMAGQYASGDFTVASDGAGGTLINNSGPVSTYAITPVPASVNENGGQITFTIIRSDTSQAATVYASTVHDQGYDNPDNEFYQGIIDQAVSFAIGQATATVRVNVNDVGIPTGSETFRLVVQQLSGDNAVGDALASDDFTINNTDASGVILTPSAETVNGGTAVTYTVTLAHPSSQPVDLTWSTVAGTASAAGGDYTGVTDAPLYFNPGQTTNYFTVYTLAPPAPQGAESFQVVVQPKAAPGYDLANSTVTIASSAPVLPTVTVSGIDGFNLPDIINAVGQPFSGDLNLTNNNASYNFVVRA